MRRVRTTSAPFWMASSSTLAARAAASASSAFFFSSCANARASSASWAFDSASSVAAFVFIRAAVSAMMNTKSRPDIKSETLAK